MKLNWIWLIFGIVAIAAFAVSYRRWGKWLLAVIVLGVLLMASDKILKGVG